MRGRVLILSLVDRFLCEFFAILVPLFGRENSLSEQIDYADMVVFLQVWGIVIRRGGCCRTDLKFLI